MIMQTVRILFLTAAALVLLSACGPASGQEPAVGPETAPTVAAVEEAPLSTPTTVPAGYPAPELVAPPAPTLDPDYPAPPTLPPTVDPYPGGLVWVIKPVGIQCEEGTLPGYGDLRETTSTMTAAGINVAGAEMTERMVTTSCSSPTSAHFRIQIAAEDLQTALSMGWTQE